MTRTIERSIIVTGLPLGVVLALSAAARTGEATNRATVAALEHRIEVLERERGTVQMGNTVKGPFTVVDAAGRPVFRIDPSIRGLQLFGVGGRAYLGATAGATGGRLEIRNEAATRIAVMEAHHNVAGFTVSDGKDSATDRVAIGVAEDGKTNFRVFNRTHGKILEVAQEDSGGGRLHLYDPAGNSNVTLGAMHFGGYVRAQTPDGNRVAILGTEPGNALVALRDGSKKSRATLVVGSTGRPEFALFNQAHKDIVSLTENASGSGLIQLFDANGTTMIEAGTNADGLGTLHAGPKYKCVPISGVLPVLADCVVGHKP
ncbi:MAG TPA: hypothetical protein VI259_19265 [Gemmatimonadaceae bacterium]